MTKYSWLFMDLDDTLYQSTSLYNEAIYFAWEHFHKFYNIEFDDFEATFISIRTELKEKYKFKTTSHQRAVLFERVLEHYKIPFNAELLLELYETYWFAVNIYIQPFPNAIKTLEELHKQNIKVLAISDGSILSRLTKIRALKISHLIDALATSEEVIDTKPLPAPFALAMEKAKVSKENVQFLGNSYSVDIEGAKQFGLTSVWFNPTNKEIPGDAKNFPDHQIQNWSELVGIFQDT